MKAHKILKIFIIITLVFTHIFGQEAADATPKTEEKAPGFSVSEDEITSVGDDIEFTSYKGPLDTTKSAEEIIYIGIWITREMLRNQDHGGEIDRYYIKRIPPGDRQFGADIISLGPNARMNHIKNVTRLVHGYLNQNFGYTGDRASAVAFYILVYNAVKRNDREYFQSRFAPGVSSYIPEGKIGIDTHFSNWPGNTYIVIPTSTGFSAAEVGQYAMEKAGEDGDNIKEREEFNKLREEQLKEKQKQIAEKEKELAEKGGGTDEEKKALEDEKIAAADEEASIQDEKDAIAADKAAADAEQAEKDALEDSQANLSEGKIFFLKTLGRTGVHLSQELNMIDPTTDTSQILDIEKISGRHLNFVEDDPILVMYDNAQTMQLHLARVDRNTLEIKAKGSEDIFHDTQIWLYNDHIYVIGQEKADCYLLKYNYELQLQAKSTVPIYPDTTLTFYEDKVYCTVMKGNFNSHIIVLREATLSKITEVVKGEKQESEN